MLQPGQYDGGARQEFAAAPRVVNQHKKYKDPYGTDGEYIPQNIMHDRRIVRGSTHAAMVIPGGAHPETLLFQREKKKQTKKQYMGSQQMPVRRIVRTPEPPQGRHNIDIQTQQFVESLTDKPPEYETGCQTDFYIDRPPTPILMPEREGVENVGTQIQDGEDQLFDFNEEVQPILNVLCTKTQEQARMEVLEEQEMRIMKEQQREFEQLRDKQLAEAQRLEQEELRRRQEQDRRIQQMKARKEQRINMHQKLVSRALAKKLLQSLKFKTQSLLLGQGFFRPTLETKLNTVIFPYIFGKVKEYVDDDFGKDAFFDEMMLHAIRGIQDIHGNVVKNANQRKKDLKENRQRQAEEKALAKKKRQEERERLRKEAAMLELKNKIDAQFIQKGQTKEGILKQRLLSTNGNFQNTPSVGLLGGVLFQFYMALQGFCSKKPQILNKLQEDREVVFKLFYDWLRSEQHIPIELFKPTKSIAEFSQANQFGEELTQEQKQQLFPLYFSGQTDPLLNHVRQSSEEYSINTMLLNSVLQAAYLLSLQPADTKQQLFAVARERISESELPDQFNPVLPSAIVRIKVPLSRPQPDQPANQSQALDASGVQDPNAAAPEQVQKEAEQPQGAEENKVEQQQKQQEQKAADQTFAEISDIKDQVLLINPQNNETGAAIHVLHQYSQRLVRLNVLKFLEATYAEQLAEGETAEQIAEEVEAQEKSLQKRLLANLQDTMPSFDFEIN